jgi:hypothetical protein
MLKHRVFICSFQSDISPAFSANFGAVAQNFSARMLSRFRFFGCIAAQQACEKETARTPLHEHAEKQRAAFLL